LDVVHGQQSETRETSIPGDHDAVTETVSHPCRINKEVSDLIVQLMEQNWFSKNFGPKRIMSELHRGRNPTWFFGKKFISKCPIRRLLEDKVTPEVATATAATISAVLMTAVPLI
jgi:hypothetical protein